MSIPGGWKLNNSVAEFAGRTALDLVLTGCAVDANGIDFAAGGAPTTNDARIAAANNTPLRLTPPFALHFDFTTGSEVVYESFVDMCSASGFAGYNLFTTSSGVLEFMYGAGAANTNTDNRRSFTFGTLAANIRYRVSINVADTSGAATGVTGWVNGSSVTPGTSGSGGAMAYGANDFVLGNRTSYGTARNSSHRLHAACVENVAIDATDAAAWVADTDAYMDAANSSMAIDSAPSSIVRGSAFNVVVSGTSVVPTTGNTTVRINGASGPTITVNSVSGSGPWTINCTAPTSVAIQNNAVGYPLHVTVGAESRQTSNIPLSPVAGRSFINLTSAGAGTNSIVSDYSAFTPVTGDQVEFVTTTTPSSLAVAVSAAGIASYTGTLTQNNSFTYRVIRANGTVGADDSLTFTYSALTITSINGGNPIQNGFGDVPIVVSSTTGVTGVSINGVAQSFQIVNSTLIYLTNSAWPNCLYGQTVPLTVTAGGNNVSANTTMAPAGTNGYSTADGSYNAAALGTILATPAIVSGDQLEFEYPSANGVNFTMPGSFRPVFAGPNPGSIRVRVLDAADKTFGNWFTWLINADTGGVIAPVITGVTNARMGQTVTVNCSNVVNLSTASGLGIIVGGVALTGVQATGPQTLTGQMPVQGIQIGPNRPVQVTANGATSTSFNTTVQSALGQIVTLTVPYAQLSPDSPLRDPAFAAAYGHLVAGDQIEWATPSVPGGYTVSVSSVGVVTLSGGASDPTAQAVQFALIDASDSYSRSNVGIWSLFAAGVATRLQIPAGSIDGAGLPMAGRTVTANVHQMDVINNRVGPFIYTTQLTFASTGPTNLDNVNNGPIGTVRALGVASANGHSFHPITVQGVA